MLIPEKLSHCTGLQSGASHPHRQQSVISVRDKVTSFGKELVILGIVFALMLYKGPGSCFILKILLIFSVTELGFHVRGTLL